MRFVGTENEKPPRVFHTKEDLIVACSFPAHTWRDFCHVTFRLPKMGAAQDLAGGDGVLEKTELHFGVGAGGGTGNYGVCIFGKFYEIFNSQKKKKAREREREREIERKRKREDKKMEGKIAK